MFHLPQCVTASTPAHPQVRIPVTRDAVHAAIFRYMVHSIDVGHHANGAAAEMPAE
ncbi:MAG: hypothetical protein NTY19_28500 [Planctomycetota bacterium]|nr:hypothetical protein [Planctomycetota bacterium]